MHHRPDLLGVVEKAYDTSSDEMSWLKAVADQVERAVGCERGCVAYYVDASDPRRPEVSPAVGSANAPQVDIAFMNARLISEFEAGETAQRLYRSGNVATGSEQIGATSWNEMILAMGEYWPAGVADVLGISALDARRRGCAVCISLPQIRRCRRDERRRHAHVAAHLAAGLRLRRDLQGGEIAADLGGSTEAMLDPDGRVLDAVGAASSVGGRSQLRDMARRLDHARTGLRREDADLALEAWSALVSGRWTLIDHFDTDGRHFLVARKNAPELAEPAALDPRERMITSAIALGHSQKIVSYELGLTSATVSRLLGSALDKLGLKNAAELASVLGAFVTTSD